MQMATLPKKRMCTLFLIAVFSAVILHPLVWFYLTVASVAALYAANWLFPKNTTPASANISALALKAALKAKVPPPVVVLESKNRALPFVGVYHVPFKKPVLKLDAAAASLEESKLQAVFFHEMGHVSARDTLDKLVWLPAYFAAFRMGEFMSYSFMQESQRQLAKPHAEFNAVIMLLIAFVSLVSPVLLMMLSEMSSSRRAELAADRFAVRSLPTPQAFLSGLSFFTPSLQATKRFDSHPSYQQRQSVVIEELEKENISSTVFEGDIVFKNDVGL